MQQGQSALDDLEVRGAQVMHHSAMASHDLSIESQAPACALDLE